MTTENIYYWSTPNQVDGCTDYIAHHMDKDLTIHHIHYDNVIAVTDENDTTFHIHIISCENNKEHAAAIRQVCNEANNIEYEMNCIKKTNDNWCPSVDGKYVNLSFFKVSKFYTCDDDLWRIVASGDDDMDITVNYTDENQGLCDFQSLLGLEYVDISDVMCLSGEVQKF